MYKIWRPAGGITLNMSFPEFVLDGPEGEPKVFNSAKDAVEFMVEAGAEHDDLEFYFLYDMVNDCDLDLMETYREEDEDDEGTVH